MAQQSGQSVTFMAKPDHTWIGSSCHIHSSLWGGDEALFSGESTLFKQYLAGMIACAGEFAVFLAPNINSYKRYAAGSWAPTTLAWGYDNRTCGFRVVGHGKSLRVECRIPGADANPYLAFAALLAAGLHGIEHQLELPPVFTGNAYESDVKRFPHTLNEAISALEHGTVARSAFGDDVVEHYLNYARTEQQRFDKAVTCYERERFFERG
jgi:glutamine synthetase